MEDLVTIIFGLICFFITLSIFKAFFRAIFPKKSSVKKLFKFAFIGWLVYMFTREDKKKKKRNYY